MRSHVDPKYHAVEDTGRVFFLLQTTAGLAQRRGARKTGPAEADLSPGRDPTLDVLRTDCLVVGWGACWLDRRTPAGP